MNANQSIEQDDNPYDTSNKKTGRRLERYRRITIYVKNCKKTGLVMCCFANFKMDRAETLSMADSMLMMLGSDDEDFEDDVQDLINSRDWDSSSENEDGGAGDTDAPMEGKEPQPHFAMGDVSASWNIPSQEEKRKHFSFMFETGENLGSEVEIPPNAEGGAGDYANDENGEISDEIGKEFEFHQEAAENIGKGQCEFVYSDEEDSDFGGEDFVLPPSITSEKKFCLDDLVGGISSPLDHSTPFVKPADNEFIPNAELGEIDVPVANQTDVSAADETEVSVADESIREEPKNLSFLDELLLSPMMADESAEAEASESKEAADSINFENIGVDSEANIWQYKPKGYGHDFMIETGVYQPRAKFSNSHQFMSHVQVDYLEKLHLTDTCADILALTKPPQPVFSENQVFQPLSDYWSVAKPASALESFNTHDIQKYVCAALNSRVKLELVFGVDEDGKTAGCVVDRCKRDVIQQAIEFAFKNDIQPQISASVVDFQLKQVGPHELDKYIVEITVNEIVLTLHRPVSGRYFFKDGDEFRHIDTFEEAQLFTKNELGYKPVKLWPTLVDEGYQCLSPWNPHKSRRRFLVPSAFAAVFLVGFIARRSLSRFL